MRIKNRIKTTAPQTAATIQSNSLPFLLRFDGTREEDMAGFTERDLA